MSITPLLPSSLPPPLFFSSPPHSQDDQHPLPENVALCIHPCEDRHKLPPNRRGLHGLEQIIEDLELQGGSSDHFLLLLILAIRIAAAAFSLGARPTWKAQAEAPEGEKVDGGRVRRGEGRGGGKEADR